MKITFTYGDTVKIILNENSEGFYVYTPDNNLTSPIEFFSIKDAILFFSSFLPIKVYDKDENSLSFVVTIDYGNKIIEFYMSDEDKIKIVWTEYTSETKGFNDYLQKNKKIDDSIDNIIRYFIKWVNTTQEKKESSVLTLTYSYFTSTVEWDNNTGNWFIKHIYNKDYADIINGKNITGKYIQELQARFEDYIGQYLKKKNGK
jgi:hypothetical protein